MKKRSMIVWMSLVWMFFAGAGFAEELGTERRFTLNRLDDRVAETWYWDLCDSIAKAGESCYVLGSSPGGSTGLPRTLIVRGPQGVHAAFARKLAEKDVGPSSHRFQILLVAASKASKKIDVALPAHARKALEDVKDFLPFSQFDLVSSAFIEASRVGVAQMAGLSEQRSYDIRLDFSQEQRVDRIVLNVSGLEVLERGAPPRRSLINATLALEIGETAVVGTSKLNGGDTALMVLITAVR